LDGAAGSLVLAQTSPTTVFSAELLEMEFQSQPVEHHKDECAMELEKGVRNKVLDSQVVAHPFCTARQVVLLNLEYGNICMEEVE
jgi:hypothetical protein